MLDEKVAYKIVHVWRLAFYYGGGRRGLAEGVGDARLHHELVVVLEVLALLLLVVEVGMKGPGGKKVGRWYVLCKRPSRFSSATASASRRSEPPGACAGRFQRCPIVIVETKRDREVEERGSRSGTQWQ